MKNTLLINFNGPLADRYEQVILSAARMTLSSIRESRFPTRIRVTVKRLNANRRNANPTGWTDCRREVILRISDNPKQYPCVWKQGSHTEWPRIKMRNPAEAVFLVAAHEFAHIALFRERMSSDRKYHAYPNFEEWLCENVCINSLLIRRGVVTSALL